MRRPGYDASVNVVGTVNTLAAAQEAGAQVIFSSSGGAGYGECPGPVAEDFPFLPLSPYGIAKKCGEEYLAGWNRIHGTSHVSLRFANVYGPRQDSGLEGGVVSIFLERMAEGSPTVIFGDGGHARDFVYVGDVVEALIAAVGQDGGPYNIGTGVETTVGELHTGCARVAGVEDRPEHAGARLGDVHRSVLDVSLAAQRLGWRPKVPLDEGLRATWAWMRQEAS
jgi:UDP-glucose 4-epimerase